MPIYKLSVEKARCEAVFPGDEWSIPLFRADFPASTSKSVEVVPKLPPSSESAETRSVPMPEEDVPPVQLSLLDEEDKDQ